MPQMPKHIPIQMLFIVCKSHPIHDILFLVQTPESTLYICNLKILYAFPTPPTTSSPSPFRGCTFRSFGCFSAIQICIPNPPKIAYSHQVPIPFSCIAHDTPTCTAYFDTPTAHVRRFP